MKDKEVVLVAGMATRLGGSLMLQMLKTEAGFLGCRTYCVEGVHSTDTDKLSVSTPSRQAKEIEAICGSKEKSIKRLVVGHCAGALAVVDTLKKSSYGHTKGLLIAPPLPRPIDILMHSRIQKRIREYKERTRYIDVIQTYGRTRELADTAPALIPSEYTEEFQLASSKFSEHVRGLAEKDMVRVVVGQYDWNEGAATAVAGWPGVMQLRAKHELSEPTKDYKKHYENCRRALHFGLESLDDSSIPGAALLH